MRWKGQESLLTASIGGRVSLTSMIFAAMVSLVSVSAAADATALAPSPFKALPRTVNYNTALAPANGAKALIVYAKNAPWMRAEAERVRTLVKAWSGADLSVADDLKVTSDETWLVADAYRKTPLIVLGNAKDNRVLQALGTRYLDYSNHVWPGGDRFVIRTVVEPFVADANYIVLEASTPEGLAAATDKFGAVLSTLKKSPDAVFPHTILAGGVKDKWAPVGGNNWGPSKDYYGDMSKSVTEIAAVLNGKSFQGWFEGVSQAVCMGGFFAEKDPQMSPGPDAARAAAAKVMNDSRGWGGRIHQPANHYGAMGQIIALRSVMSAGVLTQAEYNEAENWLTLSAANPAEYFYDSIGGADGHLSGEGGRHFAAAALITVNLLDYVRNHCVMDEPTRKEIERRYEGARKSLAAFELSFRDNYDTAELGENSMLLLYAQLHQGMTGVVKNGSLRRMADAYAMTSDNLIGPVAKNPGCYAGLDSYLSAAPGLLMTGWHGRGLLAAAAWYYDDPQYRWYLRQLGYGAGIWGSVGTSLWCMTYDPSGKVVEPTRYDGVVALPFDQRIYSVVANDPGKDRDWARKFPIRLPVPAEKAIDRLAFRDGMKPDNAYLFLATSQRIIDGVPFQNNTIARYTDLGNLWLYHNTMLNTIWGRNAVCISNGMSSVPTVGCTLEALANLGEFSMASSKEAGIGGCDWIRTIVHWRGHYFVVLDKVQALDKGKFNIVSRWRSPNPSRFDNGVWTSRSDTGNIMRIQPGEPVKQKGERREMDGAAKPYVLSQFKSTELLKGQSETFQNLLCVSGSGRADEFEVRSVNDKCVAVRGKAGERAHLALIGTAGGMPAELPQTDAAIFAVADGKLHLAGVTNLTMSGSRLFSSSIPVNLLLDCATGKGEVETREGVKAQLKLGSDESGIEAGPGRSPVDIPGIRSIADIEKRVGEIFTATKDSKIPPSEVRSAMFDVRDADKMLESPLRMIPVAKLTTVPAANHHISLLTSNQYASQMPSNNPMWRQPKDVVISVEFEKPERISHLRLVSTMEANLRGKKIYGPDDLKCSVELSNDNFQKDIRVIENPAVTPTEVGVYTIHHKDIGRLPSFDFAIHDTARYVRIKPVSVNPAKLFLAIQKVELYAEDRGTEVFSRVFAVDLDGDGGNELVAGTSDKEVAAYDGNGKQLWSHRVPGEIFTMDCADMDGDGKSKALVYTLMEKLHCFNGDGSERSAGDIYQAQLRKIGQAQLDGQSAAGGALAMGVWAPEDPKRKETLLWSEVTFRVKADGSTDVIEMDESPRGSGRMLDMYPGEREVLVTVGDNISLWSPRLDKGGNYTRLATRPTAGPSSAWQMHGFGWVQSLNIPGYKGFLAANEGGINWCPIDSFLPGSTVKGWSFSSGGVPVTAVLAQDFTGDGVPEVFLARQDGFINVLWLSDGKQLNLLSTGEPILGMAVLRGKDGKPLLAVGTSFGVYLFNGKFKQIDLLPVPMIAFAGPAGQDKDSVFLIAPSGKVQVAKLRK